MIGNVTLKITTIFSLIGTVMHCIEVNFVCLGIFVTSVTNCKRGK
jgi:hypothetical protein